jgi:SAM-dependent methyltransferase
MGFKDHFSGHAAEYAEARPSYPAALFDFLARQCQQRELAWDAGCGNGQASLSLADRFAKVFASDPSTAQIANAPLHAAIRYAIEAAEQCSLDSASADLVTVAQALHWFDVPQFFAEAKRVLKPDGTIAVWTYAESRVTPAVDAVFDELHHRRLGGFWPAERAHVLNGYCDLPFPFEPIPAPSFAMTCDWRLPQYLAYLRSWSAYRRCLAETGCDAVAEIEGDMRQAWGDSDRVRRVNWPLSLRLGRR